MRRLRVALSAQRASLRRGGGERYVLTVARLLAEAGHQVWLFAAQAEPAEWPAGVHFCQVPGLAVAGLRWLRAYHFAANSERAIRRFGADLVIGFDKTWYQDVLVAVGGAHPATLVSSGRRFRSAWGRGLWRAGKAASPKQWVFRRIADRQFRWHQPRVIAPSRMSAVHFQHYHGVPREMIRVVYNAVDRDVTMADRAGLRVAVRRQWGLGDDEVAVLFAACNYSLKGLEPLLNAFARLVPRASRARLVVCGSHHDRRYRRHAGRLGVAGRVVWLPYVEDMRRCYAACDAFALPTFYDPCSLAVLEAMCAGLPAVTTRQNGASELIRHGVDGFVIPWPWATEELAGHLGRLVRDEPLRRGMAEEARRAGAAFTLEARRSEILEALVGDPHGRVAWPSRGAGTPVARALAAG